jgi:hypothetical protein
MSRSEKDGKGRSPYLRRGRDFRAFAHAYVRTERHLARAALRAGRTPVSRRTHRHSAMWDYW